MFVDQPGVPLGLSDFFHAQKIAGAIAHEIAIHQAVIIEARGCEGISHHENEIIVSPLNPKSTMIERLSRIKMESEIVLTPFQAIAIHHSYDIFDGVVGHGG